jgi:hypothetical protein
VQLLLQVSHPWRCAGGVRELAGEPGPLLDLGEQVGMSIRGVRRSSSPRSRTAAGD